MLSEQPWDQRTEWTKIRVYGEDFPLPSKEIVAPSLDEANSTRADNVRLSYRELVFKNWQQDIYPDLLDGFKSQLQKIGGLEDNWDTKGSKKPSDIILCKGHNVLENFLYTIVNAGRLWIKPFVSSDEDGYITIQWNSGNHELHIEISEETIEYIKIWGVSIQHEMHLGILKRKEYLNLWDWLNE